VIRRIFKLYALKATGDGGGTEPSGRVAPKRSDYFARVTVDADAGTVTWPNGADMAPEPLYAEARQNSSRSAAARHCSARKPCAVGGAGRRARFLGVGSSADALTDTTFVRG